MKTESNKNLTLSCFIQSVLGVFFILVILFALSLGANFKIVWTLLTGWCVFLFSKLGNIHFNWEMIACGVVALATGCYGFHRLALWLRKDKGWKWKWTFSIVTLMLFLFAASISMTGIIHQSAWLVKSPVLENRRDGARTKSVGHLSQVKLGLIDYHSQKGKYPENLEQLREIEPKLPNALLYQQTSSGWEPWVYFGHLHNDYTDKEQVLKLPLVMTPSPHRDKYVCLDSEGPVLSLTIKDLLKKYPLLLRY